MAANYLHGIETVVINDGPRPVRLVKTAVTGLVCVAPTGPVNTPTLVLSDIDVAQFGPDLWDAGFTARAACNANFNKGLPNAGVLFVVNVLDPAVHQTTVDAEVVTLAGNTGATAFPAVIDDADIAARIVLKNSTGSTTYVRDTDYSFDPVTGRITRIAGGAIAAGASLKADYTYADPAKVLSADIIGTVDEGGHRTGMQTFLDCFQTVGFFPKRLIAPVYSSTNSVAVAMISMADRIRARAYIDAPVGITPAQAIAGRGPSGAINFNTSSPRARLFYPHVKVLDPATNAERLEPMSQHAAGLGNAVDIAYGYWFSMSNREIAGVTGVERPISAMVNDPNTEANLLNEVGITTVFNQFGSGLRLWGNRTAAWPTDTSPYNFENMQAVSDIIAESIEYSCLQFIDLPIDNPWIEAVKESVNGFLRKLIGDRAILDGACWYDPADNPNAELALGHATFRYDFLPPFPCERLTFKTRININYLSSLGTTGA